jgi:hypothetical protein
MKKPCELYQYPDQPRLGIPSKSINRLTDLKSINRLMPFNIPKFSKIIRSLLLF